MSSDAPQIDWSLKLKEKSWHEIIADFEKLKAEAAEINARIKVVESAPLSNPPANVSNEMLGEVLNELKMIRQEVKEIKENVNWIKLEQEAQKEELDEY